MALTRQAQFERYADIERAYAAELCPIHDKYLPLLEDALAEINATARRLRTKPPHSADGHGPTRSTPGVVGPPETEGQSNG